MFNISTDWNFVCLPSTQTKHISYRLSALIFFFVRSSLCIQRRTTIYSNHHFTRFSKQKRVNYHNLVEEKKSTTIGTRFGKMIDLDIKFYDKTDFFMTSTSDCMLIRSFVVFNYSFVFWPLELGWNRSQDVAMLSINRNLDLNRWSCIRHWFTQLRVCTFHNLIDSHFTADICITIDKNSSDDESIQRNKIKQRQENKNTKIKKLKYGVIDIITYFRTKLIS